MTDFKMMPNNLEAEQAVLGCVLLDNDAQGDIMGILKENDFYSESHKNIFSAMQKIYQKSVPIDFVTLTDELEIEKRLEQVGGIDYITFLTNVVPSSANFMHYCDIVKANSIRRILIKSGQMIIEDAYKSEDKDKSVQFAEKTIFDISQKEELSTLEHVGKPGGALNAVLKKFDEIAQNHGQIRGIPTGLKDFDEITNGLHSGDLIILAARPGVGKTTFAMNLVVNASIEQNKKCAVFSLEMPREQLMQRSLCSVAKVDMSKALKGTMDQEEWKRIWVAEKRLAASGIYIDDSSLTTPTDILSKCRRLKAKEGLDIVMIDYLQLMSSGGKNKENRQQEISDITRVLKIAAKELQVPIILLSQLSRAVEIRNDHKPQLSDLRESGSIEQDADIVLFLYDPSKYNDVPTEDEPGTVELIIAKHRNGRTDTVKLRMIKESSTFVGINDRVQKQTKQQVNPDEIEMTPIEIDENPIFDE